MISISSRALSLFFNEFLFTRLDNKEIPNQDKDKIPPLAKLKLNLFFHSDESSFSSKAEHLLFISKPHHAIPKPKISDGARIYGFLNCPRLELFIMGFRYKRKRGSKEESLMLKLSISYLIK